MTTSAEIMYHRRVRLLDLAEELGNISAASRQIGVSRTRYHEWKNVAELYGLDALWPKDRRRPAQPNETPTHVVADLLAVAVVEPTLGCRQLADRLCELGYEIGKPTVQRILVDHGLGRRRERIARAAAIAALAGIITEPVNPSPKRWQSRSGSATGPPAPAISWPWTASTSATSRASARCTNSPPWTPAPGGRSGA